MCAATPAVSRVLAPSAVRSVGEASPGGLCPGAAAPVLVAHRGASGYRPEHTLPAYELAARMGADYLSVDVAITRDGHLMARHECELSATTDIATRPEHRGGRTIQEVDGYLVRGWFMEHLTLDQVRELRVIERYPHLRHGAVAYNGLLEVPTLREVLTLRRRVAEQLGRPIGVLLQLRSARHLTEQGLDPVCRLLDLLREDGLDRPDAPVVVAGDDFGTLERLKGLGAQVPLHLRVLVAEHTEALRDLSGAAEVVSGLQPDKQLVRPRRFDGSLGPPTGLVEAAHAAGLVVMPWVFRAENVFLPEELRLGDDESRLGRAADEIRAFLATGIDGFCTDHTDRGVLARRSSTPA